ncbi:hypothetical protein VNI00_001061 [Paramarasmius palmivorus]|uniref:Uncharacterized protein n=1 Tax=Paramarasmius palmivorus TaxID=297713 RepID=A0AAW0E7V3_9AGAR
MRVGVQRLGRHYFSSAGPVSRQLTLLEHSISTEPPSTVYSRYIAALNTLGDVPLPIHRAVLRKCTPAAQELRAMSNSSIKHRTFRHLPQYEARLQTVMRNIRAQGGSTPADYRFVLEQFAATGNYEASLKVLREMSQTCKPDTHTYSLCLQALARALTLPSPTGEHGEFQRKVQKQSQDYRLTLLRAARSTLRSLTKDMEDRDVPFTPITLDLTLRIMKETSDRAGFETLLQTGYGIDVSYPDQAPLNGGKGLFPLSTDALNVILDFYAQERDISKLIQMFEVLTNPLPHSVTHYSPNSFDGEDDDDFGVPSEDTSQWSPPAALPNTTSFQIMLKAFKDEHRPALARHYLLQAMELSYSFYAKIRHELVNTPNQHLPSPSSSPYIIHAPKVSVTYDMFSGLLGSERPRLILWARHKLLQEIRRKREEYAWFIGWWQGLERAGAASLGIPGSPSLSGTYVPLNPYKVRWRPEQKIPQYSRGYLSAAFSHLTEKPLSLPLHLRILQKDLREMTDLLERVNQRDQGEKDARNEEAPMESGLSTEMENLDGKEDEPGYLGPGRRILRVREFPSRYSPSDEHELRQPKPTKEISGMKGLMGRMGVVSSRKEDNHAPIRAKVKKGRRLYELVRT